MIALTWPCPLAGGGVAREYALAFDRTRERRLLIVPALFDEANRLRRLTVETMRRLDAAGIDSVLPDLPGCNESLQALRIQEPQDWSDAMAAAAAHFGATHVLGIRGGCLFTPTRLPAWHYAPAKGASLLRQMLRARILASREAGREETREGLMELALREGIELTGHRLGAEFVRQFEQLVPGTDPRIGQIAQEAIGGSGLWLRAEPGESPTQADALAAILALETTA
ncbi:hypothetical protein [Novosphingobium album (ex Liu et al. 2023)]|uniref:Uncharacterized protein n=1 Tax=Novosphingobium album (ex Liu et al. 2023) TaxID=3031130 RepID=A0ABT5WUG3_9SPHN|nr:hypothetical protein [Novosphingobium album (ex Liu et al. 2023)]MDE8653545.1 hypothetical protein [Novosphingobium album (ex Liu et al. 2023)]